MDDIQRKLALIDRELAGGRDLHEQIVSTSPLVFVAVGLIAGILIQDILMWSIQFWLILLLLCAIGTFLLFTVLKVIYPPYVAAYMACVCFVCLGATRLSFFYQTGPDGIRNLVTNERKLATIRGLIITEPYINKNQQWQFARFTYNDPTTSFYLKVKEIKTVAKRPQLWNGWLKASGTIRVQIGEPVLDLKAGDYIQAYCWLDRFKEVTNPGQFDVAKYLARKNVFIAASVKSRDGIKLLRSSPADIFTKLKRKLRQTATQALLGDLPLEDRSRGLLEALLLGYRKNIDSATYEAFRKTGLLHFISLSGMHLAIFVGIIWWLCKTAGLMKRARAVVCIIAIGIFLLIIPPRAPTLRAAIIAVIFCISFFFRRRSNPLNSLSLAAIILLLIRPTQVFEAGWQLSFTAVLGIWAFAERIKNFLHERTRYWFQNMPHGEVTALTRPVKWPGTLTIMIFSAGLSAWLGTAGITLYHFHTVTPLTAVWTVLIFWTVAPILIVGFFKIILSFMLPTIAMVLGIILNLLSHLLICIVEHIAHLGVSEILVGHVSLTTVVSYYGLVLFGVFAYFWAPLIKRPLLKKAIYTAMVSTIIISLGVIKWQRTHRDNLVLTCLDVGHGQAILAQLPGKANLLFDAGSMYKSDVGRRIVASFLDYSGISRIEAIIISHNDIDHINGIPEIVEHCDVNSVYANDAFINHADPWGTVEDINDCLNANGLKIQPLGKTLNLGSGANITILWPTEQVCQNEDLGDNDKSVVSLIEFAGRKILLCSDIEEFAQQEMMRLFPSLKADIVVIPHHGSAKTLEPAFIKNLDSDILIYSCGQRQYERMNRNPNKAKSFYTARDGAITACINKDGAIKTDVILK